MTRREFTTTDPDNAGHVTVGSSMPSMAGARVPRSSAMYDAVFYCA